MSTPCLCSVTLNRLPTDCRIFFELCDGKAYVSLLVSSTEQNLKLGDGFDTHKEINLIKKGGGVGDIVQDSSSHIVL